MKVELTGTRAIESLTSLLTVASEDTKYQETTYTYSCEDNRTFDREYTCKDRDIMWHVLPYIGNGDTEDFNRMSLTLESDEPYGNITWRDIKEWTFTIVTGTPGEDSSTEYRYYVGE